MPPLDVAEHFVIRQYSFARFGRKGCAPREPETCLGSLKSDQAQRTTSVADLQHFIWIPDSLARHPHCQGAPREGAFGAGRASVTSVAGHFSSQGRLGEVRFQSCEWSNLHSRGSPPSLTSTLWICWRNSRKLHYSRDPVGIIFGCHWNDGILLGAPFASLERVKHTRFTRSAVAFPKPRAFGLCSAGYGQLPLRLSESRCWKHQRLPRFDNAGAREARHLSERLLDHASAGRLSVWPFSPRPCCQGILSE